MKYEIDVDFEKKYSGYLDKTGNLPPFPKECTIDENDLYVLPSGKYLPCGAYECEDGSTMIYEPFVLRPEYQLIMKTSGK